MITESIESCESFVVFFVVQFLRSLKKEELHKRLGDDINITLEFVDEIERTKTGSCPLFDSKPASRMGRISA